MSFGGAYSNKFSVDTGLRQGNALSSALFNIVLESVVRQVFGPKNNEKVNLS